MKYFVCIILTGLAISCAKDNENQYPVTYTLHHVDQTDESLYLVESSTIFSDLPANLGSYGANRIAIKQDIRDLITIAFDLKEIVILNEDSLRIHFFTDNVEYDTTLNYTVIQDSINIDSLEGGLLSYDKENDEFIICGITSFALPGPNVISPGPAYYQLNTFECAPGYVNRDYAEDLFIENDFETDDTMGIIITKFIYK